MKNNTSKGELGMMDVIIKFIINYLTFFTAIISIDRGMFANKEELGNRIYYLIVLVVSICLIAIINFIIIKGGY